MVVCQSKKYPPLILLDMLIICRSRLNIYLIEVYSCRMENNIPNIFQFREFGATCPHHDKLSSASCYCMLARRERINGIIWKLKLNAHWMWMYEENPGRRRRFICKYYTINIPLSFSHWLRTPKTTQTIMRLNVRHTEREHMCVCVCLWCSVSCFQREKARPENGNESECKIKFTVLSIRCVTTRSPKNNFTCKKNSRLSLALSYSLSS